MKVYKPYQYRVHQEERDQGLQLLQAYNERPPAARGVVPFHIAPLLL